MPRESSSELDRHAAAPILNAPGDTEAHRPSRGSFVTDARRKVLFVVNDAGFFRSHRLRLAQEALARGFESVVACGESTGEKALEGLGIRCRVFALSRSGLNPLRDLKTFLALVRIYRDEAPDIVHHVTIKPVIYGTLASRVVRVPAVVNAIPGMGFVFTQRGFTARVVRSLVNLLYRVALSHDNMRFIFQNREDLQGFVEHTVIPEQLTYLIRGSGIDLNEFPCTPEPPEPVTFVLVARMLSDKGIREFVAAARRVRLLQPNWRFQLVGGVDRGNPSSLTEMELKAWHAEGVVEWLGQRSDVRVFLGRSHVVCLPSYREGLPKSLLEASAMGRPMIASNVPGCREVVRDGITGLLVEPRDSTALADAMLRLGQDPVLRRRLGKAARERAEALYSIEDVVRDTFLIYEELLRA
jgi:glycosyltransferase involved in cell wall biosynthesis